MIDTAEEGKGIRRIKRKEDEVGLSMEIGERAPSRGQWNFVGEGVGTRRVKACRSGKGDGIQNGGGSQRDGRTLSQTAAKETPQSWKGIGWGGRRTHRLCDFMERETVQKSIKNFGKTVVY